MESPFFDFDRNGEFDVGKDYVLAARQPTGFGLRFYSVQLTAALSKRHLRGEIEAFNHSGWPKDLAGVADSVNFWSERSTIGDGYNNYVKAAEAHPSLKVMLVFSERDHVQVAEDKPHVHHAYDGFSKSGGLWTRLNPDRAYVKWAYQSFGMNLPASAVPDYAANTEPSDWVNIEDYAYPSRLQSGNTFVPYAALAEMMDRTAAKAWKSAQNNLKCTAIHDGSTIFIRHSNESSPARRCCSL